MGSITALVTKKLKQTKTMSLALGVVGAMALAVGFASPTFAHDGYYGDGGYGGYGSYWNNNDYNRHHCQYGHYGWHWDRDGKCRCHDNRYSQYDRYDWYGYGGYNDYNWGYW